MEKHRIFHLIKGLGRGGAESLLAGMLRHASRERFEHGCGYYLPWKDAYVEDLRREGAEVVCFRARNALEFAPAFLRTLLHLRRWRPSLLHCHLPVTGLIGRLASRLLGVPLLYTEHGLIEHYHPWTRALHRWTWRLQDGVVAVSEEVAASISRFNRASLPVWTVTNGIDPDLYVPDPAAGVALRERLGIPRGSPVVGTIAGFRVPKRLDLWAEAARGILDSFPSAHFLVVGAGPLFEAVRAQIEGLGFDGRMHLAGLQSEVRPYLSAMDVFMMSSDFEGLPLALLEAMSMQLPVVSTAVGGIGEVVVQETTGFLVPPSKPALLAEAACGVLRRPGWGRELGLAGRERVREHFSVQRMSRQIEAIYRKLLGEAADA